MRIQISALILFSASLSILRAEDFWQKKPPAEWSEKDVKKLRTNSPWARDAAVTMEGRTGGPGGTGWEGQRGGGRRGGGGGGGGGGMGAEQGGSGWEGGGGGESGGGGGRGMGGGGRGTGAGGEMGGGEVRPNLPRMLVRWESAAPVREAAAKAEAPAATPFAEWSKEFYVVSLTSLSRADREAAEPDPAAVARAQDGLRSAASLTPKGKPRIQPARVEIIKTPEGRATIYLFARKDAISPEDKEVLFQTAMGPMLVKARFTLKDMTYHGRLEL